MSDQSTRGRMPYLNGSIKYWSKRPPYDLPYGEPDEALWKDAATGLPIRIIRSRKFGFFAAWVGIHLFPLRKLADHKLLGGERSVSNGLLYPELEEVLVEEGLSNASYYTDWFQFKCDRSGDLVPAQGELDLGIGPTYRDFEYVRETATRLAKELVLIKRG